MKIRYRGYCYDGESGLYYLNNRYYDPETGRFVNADNQLNTSLKIIGTDVFACCINNPINKVDYIGDKPGDLFDTIDEDAYEFTKYINAKSISDNKNKISFWY